MQEISRLFKTQEIGNFSHLRKPLKLTTQTRSLPKVTSLVIWGEEKRPFNWLSSLQVKPRPLRMQLL